MEEKKANLFLVGAMKAGTTSLVEVLATHPGIYVPPIKEPHYFLEELPIFLYEPSRFFNIDSYFTTDFPKELHIAHIKDQQQYRKLFSLQNGQQYLLDASTAYLAKPGTAGAISKYNPESKIIILTRDPLERMYSHYKMRCGLSSELRDFESVVRDELQKFNSGQLPWSSYLRMSLYGDGIREFRESFDQVLTISFESLIADPEKTLKAVSDFLGLDEFKQSDLPIANASRELKYKRLFHILKSVGLKDYFSKAFGSAFKQKLFKAVSGPGKSPMELSEGLKEQLNAIFEQGSHI